MRFSYLLICIVVGLLLLSASACASSPFSISGQVLDRYGNPVPGANVTLIDNNYKVIQEKMTSENGNYDFVNVLSDSDTCTVKVSFTDPYGKKYDLPSYYVLWYPTKGMQLIPPSQTKIPGYPEPTFGYVYGAIQTGSGNSPFVNGIVYLVSLSDDVKYYEFADRTDGKGSFAFYVPPGTYMLYAQHWENGVCYESSHKQVTVGRNTDITEVLETRIILSLISAMNNPDPAVIPTHQNNKVSGTVLAADDKPLSGLTVTLLQRSDNGSTFLPMVGADGKPVTVTTDNNGKFEFNGVAPTTDDGKTIQSKKDIRAVVEYALTENQTINAASDEKALYYPDMILSNGGESAARNITFSPMVMKIGDRDVPMPPTPTPTEPSSLAIVPLLAALAIGMVCIVGMYLFLNRKGS